jgi:hypothetical protein
VLWTGKGNTWKTISLGDVIEPKQVRAAGYLWRRVGEGEKGEEREGGRGEEREIDERIRKGRREAD